jgi:acyl-CoA synthetase (NDP forming)
VIAVTKSGTAHGHPALLDERSAWRLCDDLEIGTPRREYLQRVSDLDGLDLSLFQGDRVVLKIAGSAFPHKSDLGGVIFCDKLRSPLRRAVQDLFDRFEGGPLVEVAIHEFVAREPDPVGELLLGVRLTDEFGPVVSLGLGGLDVEQLSLWEPLLLAAGEAWQSDPGTVLADHGLTRLLSTASRGRSARVASARLARLLDRALDLGARSVPPLLEMEINPLVFVDGEPFALDVLARASDGRGPPPADRPIAKLSSLLEPRSIAIVGVSRRRNPGRVILENVVAQGYPRDRVLVVKPGVTEILGCRAVPDLSRLPQSVDLLVLAVDAGAVPDLVDHVVEERRAEAIIAIPGGLGETSGSEPRVERIEKSLAKSRRTAWRGPLLNGPNCLGVRSAPGRYDTLFIPRYKLPSGGEGRTPLAVVSQSGAFAVARLSKLVSLDPRYVVSVGNQIDLTIGDYLSYLADDPRVRVFACYVEGFRTLDGARFLEAAERITASGRPVVLYRAGRTTEGTHAAISHTAAVAGEYAIARQLAKRAGVLVAETIDDFEDLTRALCFLEDRRVSGLRLGALSNAGFECVAVGDHVGSLELASLATESCAALQDLLEESGLGGVMDVANPVDVSPIFGDRGFTKAARLVLEDPGVDIGVVGCVPLTPALQTLPRGQGYAEDVESPEALAQGLIELWKRTRKAWVVSVDGGVRYGRFRELLEAGGIPTFTTIDRAVRILHAVCRWRTRYRVFEK